MACETSLAVTSTRDAYSDTLSSVILTVGPEIVIAAMGLPVPSNTGADTHEAPAVLSPWLTA